MNDGKIDSFLRIGSYEQFVSENQLKPPILSGHYIVVLQNNNIGRSTHSHTQHKRLAYSFNTFTASQ